MYVQVQNTGRRKKERRALNVPGTDTQSIHVWPHVYQGEMQCIIGALSDFRAEFLVFIILILITEDVAQNRRCLSTKQILY